MVERNLYLVDFEIIRQRYNHIGIYGKGRDIILDIPSIIHILQDKFILPGKENGRLISMQTFQNLSSDLFQRKLDQLVKAAYLFYVPYYQSIMMISYKKNEDKTYDLIILYDFEDLIPLEDIIKEKKQNNSKFSDEEVWQIIYMLIDSMYMGSRLNYEYTDISPVNIFQRKSADDQSYIISNFGLQLPRKFERPVHCPSDRFFINKISGISKVMDLYTRSYMFQVGMVALYLLTLEETGSLYQDQQDNNRKINQKELQLRIDKAQESGVNNQLLNFLNLTLEIREDERLELELLMTDNEENNSILPRELTFYQGSLADAQNYSGFVTIKDQERTPHGVGDILTNEGQYYKGMFNQGSCDGYGIFHDGQKKFAFGKWKEDSLIEGMLINKNDYLFFGGIGDFEPAGVGVLINLATNQSANFFYFEGTFNNQHQPLEGQTYFKTGKLLQEPPQLQYQKQQQEESQLQQSEQFQQLKEDLQNQQQSFQQSANEK